MGDGRRLEDGRHVACQVREGDRVLFASWGGTEIKSDGDTLLILSEDDILAVIA